MKKDTKFHCFFEQSGTFKNEFKKLGFQAFDYDILNQFNETDYLIDLFGEIENGYNGDPSIFDKIDSKDFIIAFFPCTRFEVQIILMFKGENFIQKKWSDYEKLEKDLELHNELHNLYCLITKLVIICLKRNIRLVIENPYSTQHYLYRYWSIKPKIIDINRRLRGDYEIKPTQYWFINCDPKNNLIFDEPYFYNPIKKTHNELWGNQVERSMIHPEYARRFIREFIIDEEWLENDKQG